MSIAGIETEELMGHADILSKLIGDRTIELILAPLKSEDMIWIAIPLIATTLFITLYFGRYKREELGWNTAFGNTMVFVFVAFNLIKAMYQETGTIQSLFGNTLYLGLTVGLTIAGFFLMFVTYFHLLPKTLAFFIFSAPPINVSIYVVMSIVYANVPPDYITVLAGIVFLIGILIVASILKFLVGLLGLSYMVPLEKVELPEELAKKLREVEMEKIEEEEVKK